MKKSLFAILLFALVCAAKGCPNLIEEPYKPKKLDKQLDLATKKFLNEKDKNYIDKNNKIIYLSPIFDWFRDDFTKDSGSVISFVKPFMLKDNEGIDLKGYKIEFTLYDWSLNKL